MTQEPNPELLPEPQSLAASSPHGALGALHFTFGAGLLVQGAAALAGFLVVPILVPALGSAQFGILTVIVSFGPWLVVLDTGLQAAMRLLAGEYRRRADGRAPASLLGRGYRYSALAMTINSLLVLGALFLLPLDQLLGAQGVVPDGQLRAAVAVFSFTVIATSPGAVVLGSLEGVGRTVASAALAGLGPIAALPLTLLFVRAGSGLVALAFVQGLAIALPRLCALAYWKWRPSLQPEAGRAGARGLRVVLVGQLALLSALSLAQTGLAPVVVASRLGSDAAASYGIAWRLVGGALIPLLVLVPFFTAALAAARGAGWSANNDRDLLRLLGHAAGAGAGAGLLLVAAGPFAARMLGGSEVPVPMSLLVAGAFFLLATYVAAPLQAAFAGPRALLASVLFGLLVTALAVGLSLLLTPHLGVAGPIWAASIAALGTSAVWITVWRLRPALLAEVHIAQQR